MNSASTRESHTQATDNKQGNALVGPGTAGLVQRIPSHDQPNTAQLRILTPVKAETCSQNQF